MREDSSAEGDATGAVLCLRYSKIPRRGCESAAASGAENIASESGQRAETSRLAPVDRRARRGVVSLVCEQGLKGIVQKPKDSPYKVRNARRTGLKSSTIPIMP
jgi:hypothetical protein